MRFFQQVVCPQSNLIHHECHYHKMKPSDKVWVVACVVIGCCLLLRIESIFGLAKYGSIDFSSISSSFEKSPSILSYLRSTGIYMGASVAPSAKPRVVVIGPARDVAGNLDGLLQMTRRLRRQVDIIHFIVFENDSTDGTVDLLKQWKEDDISMHVESETNMTGTRTVKLAHARNRLWELVAELPNQESIDYVFAIDMDDVNVHLAHVENCWNGGLPENWTVCCTNTYFVYYDLWALRTFANDSWVGDRDVLQIPKHVRQSLFRHIPASEPPIPAKSCFGGAAMYRYQKIRHLNLTTYEGLDEDGNWICEHVVFHERLLQQLPSAEFYIQPKMLNDGKVRGPLVRKRLLPEFKKTLANPNLTHYYNTSNNFS